MRPLLLLLGLHLALAEPSLTEYRVRGYMQYTGVVGGGAGCANSFIVACARMSSLPLRLSPEALKLLPPSTGWALMGNTMITCPESVAPITSDSSGNNMQASGVFKRDPVTPQLVPATSFVVSAGGTPHTLQLRTLPAQCIYEFQLTMATSSILGVEPVGYISLWSNAARSKMLSPAAALVSLLAALAAMWALH